MPVGGRAEHSALLRKLTRVMFHQQSHLQGRLPDGGSANSSLPSGPRLEQKEILKTVSTRNRRKESNMTAASRHVVVTQPLDVIHWTQCKPKLKVSRIPTGALNLNVDGRHVLGPLQGFGQLWRKTFRICKRQEESEPSATVKLSHLLSNQPVRTMSPASVNSGESESSHLP
jgi:hypothetical protein